MTDRPEVRAITRDAWKALLESKNVRAWYMQLGVMPRAFYLGGVIYVRSDQAANLRLIAHELGHHKGLDHPPRFSWANLVDVMGESPVRLADRHGLKAEAVRLRLVPSSG